jgi:hypothetical protein
MKHCAQRRSFEASYGGVALLEILELLEQLNALAAAGDASDRVIPSHSPENQSVRFLGSSHFAVARRAY